MMTFSVNNGLARKLIFLSREEGGTQVTVKLLFTIFFLYEQRECLCCEAFAGPRHARRAPYS